MNLNDSIRNNLGASRLSTGAWRSDLQEEFDSCSVLSFRMRDSHGWQHVFTSPYMEESIEKIALNTKMPGSQGDKMVAVASGISFSPPMVYSIE